MEKLQELEKKLREYREALEKAIEVAPEGSKNRESYEKEFKKKEKKHEELEKKRIETDQLVNRETSAAHTGDDDWSGNSTKVHWRKPKSGETSIKLDEKNTKNIKADQGSQAAPKAGKAYIGTTGRSHLSSRYPDEYEKTTHVSGLKKGLGKDLNDSANKGRVSTVIGSIRPSAKVTDSEGNVSEISPKQQETDKTAAAKQSKDAAKTKAETEAAARRAQYRKEGVLKTDLMKNNSQWTLEE